MMEWGDTTVSIMKTQLFTALTRTHVERVNFSVIFTVEQCVPRIAPYAMEERTVLLEVMSKTALQTRVLRGHSGA
jgi:hypothetical protein